MATPSRCKHEPVLYGNIIDNLAGRVHCGRCGMKGLLSNGRRMIGRMQKVHWLTSEPLMQRVWIGDEVGQYVWREAQPV